MEHTVVQTTRINGTELTHLEQGQGQPVIFVHGGVGDHRAWDLQIPAFAARFRAIALSCRGAWPNPKLEPDATITLDTFVEDLASFIKGLDLAPAHLVGHSSPGGFGGLVLAHRYPELLRSLVLLEPPAFPLLGVNIPPKPLRVLRLLARNPTAGIGFVKFGARGIAPAMRAFNRGDDERGLRVFMAAVAGKERVADIPDEKFREFVGNVGPLKAQLRAGFPPLDEDEARSIRVPTLLVSGTDTPAPLAAVTDRLEELLPDVARLNITGASHNMFNSHPAEFNAGVMDFLEQHWRAASGARTGIAGGSEVTHRIYHLALESEWREASKTGVYHRSTLGKSLEDEGFIHCSFANQVQGIADAIYHGRHDVVLLEIDPSRVNADVRVENLDGGEERFPHIYGPLPTEAVSRAQAVPVGVDGQLIVGPATEPPAGRETLAAGWTATRSASATARRSVWTRIPSPPSEPRAEA